MSEQELRTWFFDIISSCYPVVHDDFENDIFLYYDKSVIRRLKLLKINGDVYSLPKVVSGVCLFDIDIRNKQFYCNNVDIWNIFEINYSSDYYKIKSLISSWLVDVDIDLIVGTSSVNYLLESTDFKNILKVYESNLTGTNISFMEEIKKLRILV